MGFQYTLKQTAEKIESSILKSLFLWQGAKPGEGGELPGHKVRIWVNVDKIVGMTV